MFTDIVGYTGITQTDEARAMQILRTHNELLRPVFQKDKGREIKTIGDAFLIEFESALDAVNCAIEVQYLLRRYNEDPAISEQNKIRIRVGVHLGDVIHRENDVFGDAVNIASRIQPLAEPEGICVSEQVFHQVRNKLQMEFQLIEGVHLKNVIYPVGVYRIILPWSPKYEEKEIGQSTIPIKRRLAVLPLEAGDEYFAEGLTEELITVLSNIKDLRIIARTSIQRYKGTTKSVVEIGKELNVGSILEGSVRKTDNRVRVTVEVVDALNDEHMWASSYDREMVDIFSVQTDIAKQVAKALRMKLRTSEKVRIVKKPTLNIDAYSLYLKGRFAMHKRNRQAIGEAIELFSDAIKKDEKYAKAYSGLADCYLISGSYGYGEAQQAYSKAKEYVSRALEFDENLPEAHISLGFLLEAFYYDFAGSREQFEHAIKLNPSNSQARHWYAINLAISNQIDQAIAELERAKESDPLSAQIGTVLGGFYTYEGRDEEALRTWESVLRSNPNNVPVYLNRGVYFAKLGKKDEALYDMSKALSIATEAVEVKCLFGYVHAVLGRLDEALEILAEVKSLEHSKKEYVSPFYLAVLYAGLGDNEECINYVRKSIEDKSAEIESLIHDSMFERVRPDPRLREMLEKIGVSLVARPAAKKSVSPSPVAYS